MMKVVNEIVYDKIGWKLLPGKEWKGGEQPGVNNTVNLGDWYIVGVSLLLDPVVEWGIEIVFMITQVFQ